MLILRFFFFHILAVTIVKQASARRQKVGSILLGTILCMAPLSVYATYKIQFVNETSHALIFKRGETQCFGHGEELKNTLVLVGKGRTGGDYSHKTPWFKVHITGGLLSLCNPVLRARSARAKYTVESYYLVNGKRLKGKFNIRLKDKPGGTTSLGTDVTHPKPLKITYFNIRKKELMIIVR